MPANLSPEYKAAEASFRKARDPHERLDWLHEMLRTIPKHKGTDHLQADIKRRIKELSEELEGPKKGGARSGPALVIRPEGAAQIALVGPPNSGKSALHARLTGSSAPVAEYPFTTQYPEPGMLIFDEVHLQLVDLPAVSLEHPVPWLAGALQMADACLLVVDLGDPDCVGEVEAVRGLLAEKRVTLTDRSPGDSPTVDTADENAERETFRELTGLRYPALGVSATTGEGLREIGPWLVRHLGIVRVYTKAPGKPPAKDHPFALRRGQTVEDVARLVHKDLVQSLKYARVWGRSSFDGQHVGREHVVEDGDVIELHA